MGTSLWRNVVTGVLLLGVFSLSVYAQNRGGPPGGPPRGPSGGPPSAPKPAPTKPAPNVVVTKKDKSTVRGQLIASDPASVTIKTKDAEESIPWSDIATISNGFTHAKALEQYRKDHGDNLCDTCHGEGKVRCDTCKGTGHDPASGKDCATCKGELLVDCKTPKCDKGQIPCTNKNCLKRSEGRWYERDGKMVRDFPTSKGTAWYSEGHAGHLIVKEGDVWNDKGICPTCNGKQTVADPACEGTSKRSCPECTKREGAEKCKDCENGEVACKTCNGTGMKKVPAPGSGGEGGGGATTKPG